MNAIRCVILAALFFGTVSYTGCSKPDAEGDEYVDRMAEEHADDQPEPSAIAQEPIVPVRAQPVEYTTSNGEPTVGYLAAPEKIDSVAEAMGMAPGDTALPAIIVIHEWWGLNDNIKAMTRRLAGEGYRALAVDLYNGEVAQQPDQAQALMGLAMEDRPQLAANLEAAYTYLTNTYSAPTVGVIGWCFGGGMALNAALAMPRDLDAAVIYYGHVGEASREQLATLEMPILGFFGGQDQSIPVETVRAFETTLDDLGKDAEVHVYESAGHAFANPSGQNYVADAAEDAWDKTTAFLKKQLYGQRAGA